MHATIINHRNTAPLPTAEGLSNVLKAACVGFGLIGGLEKTVTAMKKQYGASETHELIVESIGVFPQASLERKLLEGAALVFDGRVEEAETVVAI